MCRSCCSTSRRARDWTWWSRFATRLRRGSGTRFTVVWLTSLLFNNRYLINYLFIYNSRIFTLFYHKL
ncbi:LOB domain-containing protein 18 [Phtheirospermum japonicum]|uniref:LOB domain-containing protein 18 n=1 Tax=Phtheirospermum japonicum TaxID=374723 RepID=A0A830CX47_9LAMI|nr:LOB domain-containing protein 18 [Phtheirospermum japonicum]